MKIIDGPKSSIGYRSVWHALQRKGIRVLRRKGIRVLNYAGIKLKNCRDQIEIAVFKLKLPWSN